VEQVDVWAAGIPDRPGALGVLRDAGADLQFIITRRTPEEAAKGVVFVTPLRGDREVAAAAQAGFNVTQRLHCVRAMGTDRPGMAAALAQKLADRGINLRGFSAAVLGTQFVAYVAMDSLEDVNIALQVLQDV
jgi:hypothetical protein